MEFHSLPPSLNVWRGHLQERVILCFLRSVTAGILIVKLLHGLDMLYMYVRQSQQEEKICEKRQ